jgi:hypothetical protein
VPIGCGSASVVILILLFAGGAMLTGARLARFMDFVLGTTITATQKQRFDAEVKRMGERPRSPSD